MTWSASRTIGAWQLGSVGRVCDDRYCGRGHAIEQGRSAACVRVEHRSLKIIDRGGHAEAAPVYRARLLSQAETRPITGAPDHLNRDRNRLDPVADHSRGKVSQGPLDSRPAAMHSRGDRIATGHRTPDAPAKRHTVLRVAAVADRNQAAGHRGAPGHTWKVDRSLAAHRTGQAGCSQGAGHKQKADRKAVARHPRLQRDREELERRTALPWRQSQ